MNCLATDPVILMRYISRKRYYNYRCLDRLTEFSISNKIYYDCLLSCEEFKLKNIWNHIITRWNRMKRDLSDNDSFVESGYSEKNFMHHHRDLIDESFDDLLISFVDDEPFKCLFVCNCIQHFITEK